MSFQVQWAPVALQDLEEIIDSIEVEDSADAAESWASKMLDRIESLRHYPRRCRIAPELKEAGIREYREPILAPYRVFFRITGLKVGILGVLDGRRDLEEIIIRRYVEE